MSLQKIQHDVEVWTGQFTPQYWPPYEILARLTEELGEVGREVNHLYGTKKKKATEATKSLSYELVDVIFTVVCMANSHGINLSEAWDLMMKKKLYGRDQQRFEKKV